MTVPDFVAAKSQGKRLSVITAYDSLWGGIADAADVDAILVGDSLGMVVQGKSTTLACLVDQVNRNRRNHIITIEDPIEFVFESKKSLIRQREVGMHTKGVAPALRAALLVGYRSVRPFPVEHERFIDTFIALRFLQLMMYRIEERDAPMFRDTWFEDVTGNLGWLERFLGV